LNAILNKNPDHTKYYLDMFEEKGVFEEKGDPISNGERRRGNVIASDQQYPGWDAQKESWKITGGNMNGQKLWWRGSASNPNIKCDN
jgi:hypothetical protein